jgi:hypothetical protein
MFGVFMHLFCVCVVLCLGSGLATGQLIIKRIIKIKPRHHFEDIRGRDEKKIFMYSTF